MNKLVVNGGRKLSGEIKLQGAKNSILPVLSATVLTNGETVLENCPDLSDVYASCRILSHIGLKIRREKPDVIVISGGDVISSEIPDSLMNKMRSSVNYLGSLLGRCGECSICFPGGCQLGPRPLDIHLAALRSMGVLVSEEYGYIKCTAPHGVKGAKITLPFPSVGATENIILAAVLADGETEIRNAAREPEINDLISYLKKCGANIESSGSGNIFVEGVSRLENTHFRIMPDRIAAATYMAAAAATGGALQINCTGGIDADLFTVYFEQMGCTVYNSGKSIFIRSGKVIKPVKTLKTMPYPGFPTDMQAVFMSVLCLASGTSVFEENIFEDRYRHVDALNKMGADIKVYGKIAVVEGVGKLYGTDVTATDLRGGAAMVIAALSADGRTLINDAGHIDRGYEGIDKVLSSVGADITRKS